LNITGKSNKKSTTWLLLFQYLQLSLAIVYGIFMLPLYIKYIDAGTYGAWLATGSIVIWLTIIMPDCGDVLLQRLGTALGAKDIEQFNKLFSTGVIISFLLALLLFSACFAVAPFFTSWLNLPQSIDQEKLVSAFLMTSAGTAVMAFGYSFSATNLAMHSTFLYGMIGIISAILRISLVFILLIAYDLGLGAIGWGNLIYGTSFFLMHFILTAINLKRVEAKFCFHLKSVNELAVLFSFTSIGKLGQALARKIDYFLITRYLSPETTTAYRLMKAVPDATFPFSKISNSMMPSMVHFHGNGILKEKANLILGITGKAFIFSIFIAGGIVVFNKSFMTLWCKEGFFLGQYLNISIIAAVLMATISDTFQRYVFITGGIKSTSLVNSLCSLLQAGLVYFGLRYFGLIGLCIAPIIISLISAGIFMRIFIKKLNLDLKLYLKPFLDLALGIIVVIPVCLLAFMFDTGSWFNLILAGIQYSLFFGVFILLLSADCRDIAKKIIKHLRTFIDNKFIN
jgi:O-antigen/teichoic acid export membrane protein